MRKKILLFLAIMSVLVCIFAISASAAVTGSATNEYGNVSTVDGIATKDKLDETSRVVLKNADGTYTTYPAYYVLSNNTSASFDFSALNGITGENYSKTCVARIEFPNVITSIGGSMLSGDTELVEIDLPSNLQTIKGGAFQKCTNLRYIDGTDGLLIFPEGFTTIDPNNAFENCHNIKYVEFPSTFTKLGQAAFNNCDGLLLVSFDKVDEAIRNGTRTTRVDFNNCGSFKYCDNLVALSMPELTTVAINRLATGCTNLTAVYLPNTIKEIGTNGGGQGAFDDCGKMYFVQEPFTVSQCIVDGAVDLTKLNLPEKPSVYYMPTAFTQFIGHVESNQWSKGGTIFRNCVSLNDTIVFRENLTYFNGYNVLQGMGTKDSPKNIVFLGDMTSSLTYQNTSYVNFYFANPADKTPEDIGLVNAYKANNTTETYWYFCHGGARYTYAIQEKSLSTDMAVNLATILATRDEVNFAHISNPDKAPYDSEATCTRDKMTGIVECFCGNIYSYESIVENSALGHDGNTENGAVDLGVVYVNYFASGVHSYNCARCSEKVDENTDAIFIDYGYAATEGDINGTFAMSQFYGINQEALEAYKAATGNTIEYGLVAAADSDPITNRENGTLDSKKVFVTNADSIALSCFGMRVCGITEETSDAKIAFCAYIKDGDKLFYLDDGMTVTSVTMKSYNEIMAAIG